MKHRHYDMICAKAGNMGLVRFFLCKLSGKWKEIECEFRFTWKPDTEFFLCLPQHKEACLHWLNGGDIQNNITKYKRSDSWIDFASFNFPTCERWSQDCNFMRDSSKFRIKPRKEKRWIGVYGNHVTESHYKSKEGCELFVSEDSSYSAFSRDSWQFIEIEVEVNG